ncbi:MAG: DUF6580 family putative transport protein [Planctomycetaceae bacterium]
MTAMRYLLLTLMIVVPAVMRFGNFGWNFTPIGAVALFAGATFRRPAFAFLVPLCSMFASDLALGWFRQDFEFYTFHPLMPVVYSCYTLSVCLGFGIRREWNRLDGKNPVAKAGELASSGDTNGMLLQRQLPVIFGTLTGSILFFLVTNFANWIVYADVHTSSTLMEHYYVAIPFFRNTLASDAIGAAILFGGFEIVCRRAAVADPTGLLHAR